MIIWDYIISEKQWYLVKKKNDFNFEMVREFFINRL